METRKNGEGKDKDKDATQGVYPSSNDVEHAQTEGARSLATRGKDDKLIGDAMAILDGTNEEGAVVVPAPPCMAQYGITGILLNKATVIADIRACFRKAWTKSLLQKQAPTPSK